MGSPALNLFLSLMVTPVCSLHLFFLLSICFFLLHSLVVFFRFHIQVTSHGISLSLILIFFNFFYFIFKLYIIVLVLPNIKMNPPQVYMCLILILKEKVSLY